MRINECGIITLKVFLCIFRLIIAPSKKDHLIAPRIHSNAYTDLYRVLAVITFPFRHIFKFLWISLSDTYFHQNSSIQGHKKVTCPKKARV